MSHLVSALLALLAATVTGKVLLNELQGTEGLVTLGVTTVEGTTIGGVSILCSAVKQELRADSNQSSSPDLSKLTLNLYTRYGQIIYNLSTAAEEIPASSWFRTQNPVIIYMHGFLSKPSDDNFQEINAAFLDIGDYNVLALDSSSQLGLTTLYIGATYNVPFIGRLVGAVLANITKVGTSPSSIYLIGHSLGAHIASFTGKYFTALTDAKVGRITGLDPAGPCYTDIDSNLKLNKTDADFVDVIHTDAGGYGLNERIGHVDFYPNGGSVQPGCTNQTCDHGRAWQFYAETVTNNSMPGVACESWEQFQKGQCNTTDISIMGYGCDSSIRGQYYLMTNASKPYGFGVEGLTYSNTDAQNRTL